MGRRKPGKERRQRPDTPPSPVNRVVLDLMASMDCDEAEAQRVFAEMQNKVDAPSGVPRVKLPTDD